MRRVLDATLATPGFVDSHTHLAFGVPRLLDYEMRLAGAGYAEIAARGGGILSSVRSVRAMPEMELERQARTFLDAMVRHGTTTVEAKSGYGLDEEAELKTLRVLARLEGVVPTYLGPHVPPPEIEADKYIDWVCEVMLPQVRGIARFADIYCAAGAFTVAQARRYLVRARSLGLLLKIHAEQFEALGGARLAVDLGAVSADHLEQADECDAAMLADSGTVATLLPGAVFHLGLRRYPPARALLDAGATVALATDFNPGTSPTFSMQMVLSLACTELRMTPAEAIGAATLNGARALAMEDEVGSLAPGKQADMVLWNLDDYREIPYYFGCNNVRTTIRKGEIVA